jgi:hypothetical protein
MSATTTKQPTPEQKRMATHTVTKDFDFSKLSVEEMLALRDKLDAQAREQAQKQFDDTINFLGDKLKAMGRTKVDAVRALLELMSPEERAEVQAGGAAPVKRARMPRAAGAAPAGKKERADKDKNGASPEPGKTYKLGDLTWTRAANGKGATKKEFLAAIKDGKTWAELAA